LYLPEFLYYGLFILKRKSTGKRLGVVYDKQTLLPVSFAVIKVFDNKGKFVYETVSDIKGRYSSENLVEGEYEFRVEHSDYEAFIKKFRVKGEMDYDFGLKGLKSDNLKGILSRVRVTFDNIKDNFLDILILTGFLYSFFCMLLNPELVNILIVVLYFSQYMIRVIIHSRKNIGGTIIDKDGKGIKGAFVRVYDKNALQLDTNITTANGHYRFNVIDGEYYISIYKEGYDLDRNGLKDRLTTTNGGLELIECKIRAGVPDIIIKMNKQ
jgi:hypothetical protein